MKKFLITLLVAAMALTFAACRDRDGGGYRATEDDGGWYATSTVRHNLRFSFTVSEATAWGMSSQLFADLIYERTRGNVNIQVFPNEVLAGGNQAQAAEMVMMGITDLDFRSNIIFTVMNENFGVISLPFMYESAEQAHEMLQGPAGDHYRQMLLNNGLVLLGFGESGMRQLTSSTPIRTVEDLVGQRIRVPGMQLLMAAFERMGANPISMSFAEVFMALQQGAIDGQENPVDIIYGNLIYEVQNYITLWNYVYDALFLTVNQRLFDSFPPDYQRIFREVGEHAAAFQVQLNRQRIAEQLAYFESRGVTVITPTPAAMEGFRAVGAYMREMFSAPDRFGPEVVALFTPE